MAILNLPELQNHSVAHQYDLPAINVRSLSVLWGVIAWAKKDDIPFVVTVDGSNLAYGLLPSIEEILRKEEVASAIIARNITSKSQAISAIRAGCQALYIQNSPDNHESAEIESIAQSCGVISKKDSEFKSEFMDLDAAIDSDSLINTLGPVDTWQQLESAITKSIKDALFNKLGSLAARSKAVDARSRCRHYSPIEHLIIFNSSANDEQTKSTIKTGREVLDNIPGVKATWSGKSIGPNAKYRWCWLIRFANESVIASYRDHPDHVAYADNHFRPIAGDRISIDYTLYGPESNK